MCENVGPWGSVGPFGLSLLRCILSMNIVLVLVLGSGLAKLNLLSSGHG